MTRLLQMLAKATDTKGYPDDKDPNHWRKINGSPVHLDANGNIDGGAGGKFTGKGWSSSKHPHNPASYPKPALTVGDLKKAWANVAKYQVAMKRAKTSATRQKHQQNMLQAISDYQNLAKQAGPSVSGQFKPNIALALRNASATPQQPQPTPQTAQQTPLQQLGQLQTKRQGRNVKMFNLGKTKGVNGLRQFADVNGLSIPLHIYTSNDVNLLGKTIVSELNKRNQNYGSYTLADVQKIKPKKLFDDLMKISPSKLNPTLDNNKATLRLSMALGNNEPPRVVSKAEFDQLANKSTFPVMYRGVTAAANFSAKDVVDDFKYGDTTWLGGAACLWGVGIYMTTQQGYAQNYGSATIKAVIDPAKAKVIDWDDLVDLAMQHKIPGVRHIAYIGGGAKEAKDRMTMLALQMGYNVIRIHQGNNHRQGSKPAGALSFCGDFYNVLDRGCLIVEK